MKALAEQCTQPSSITHLKKTKSRRKKRHTQWEGRTFRGWFKSITREKKIQIEGIAFSRETAKDFEKQQTFRVGKHMR